MCVEPQPAAIPATPSSPPSSTPLLPQHATPASLRPASLCAALLPRPILPPRTAAVEHHHARGLAFRKLGQYSAAVQEYTRALTLDPSHFKSFFNRGFSYDKVGWRGGLG